MYRAFWFLGEVIVGVLVSGAVAAVVSPLLVRAGRDPGPGAVWLTLALGGCLGLMLLALHILMVSLAPAEDAPIVRTLLQSITADPVLCIVIGERLRKGRIRHRLP